MICCQITWVDLEELLFSEFLFVVLLILMVHGIVGDYMKNCVWWQLAVRQSAAQTLNMWVEQTGLHVFIEAEIMTDALKLENPILRAEVCSDDDCCGCIIICQSVQAKKQFYMCKLFVISVLKYVNIEC